MSEYRRIAKILLDEGEQLKSILQQELIAQDHIASGKLYDSFDVDFDVVGNSLQVSITNSAGYDICRAPASIW